MSRKIRIGLIGIGSVGIQMVKAIIGHPQAKVAVLCDLNIDLATMIAKEFKINARICRDYNEVVASNQVDAILIQTPGQLHADPFIKSLENGKHVFIQKPFAIEQEDIEKMVDAANRHPECKTYVGQCCRFERCYCQIKNIIDRGNLGSLHHIEIDYVSGYLHQWSKAAAIKPELKKSWRLGPASRGMLDGGVHAFDMVRYLSGSNAVSVYAEESTPIMKDIPWSSMITALFKMNNGMTAKVSSTFGAISPWRPAMGLNLYGEKASIRDGDLIYIDNMLNARNESDIYSCKHIKAVESELTHLVHPFKEEVEHFVDVIINDRKTRTPACDGANSAIGVVKAMESIKIGQLVKVPIYKTV